MSQFTRRIQYITRSSRNSVKNTQIIHGGQDLTGEAGFEPKLVASPLPKFNLNSVIVLLGGYL
jgi:hypothetical protein